MNVGKQPIEVYAIPQHLPIYVRKPTCLLDLRTFRHPVKPTFASFPSSLQFSSSCSYSYIYTHTHTWPGSIYTRGTTFLGGSYTWTTKEGLALFSYMIIMCERYATNFWGERKLFSLFFFMYVHTHCTVASSSISCVRFPWRRGIHHQIFFVRTWTLILCLWMHCSLYVRGQAGRSSVLVFEFRGGPIFFILQTLYSFNFKQSLLVLLPSNYMHSNNNRGFTRIRQNNGNEIETRSITIS